MLFILGFDLFIDVLEETKWTLQSYNVIKGDCCLLPPSAALCVASFVLLIHGLLWRRHVSSQASQQSSAQAVWVVPALRQLHEITRSFIKQTYQKQDKVRATSSR